MISKPMARSSALSLSLILSLSLVACGGGGGGDVPIVTPASYQPGQAELGAFEVLQQARTQCGFGALTRNAQLDAAALSHAKYLVDLSIATGISTLSHYEIFGVVGFTGEDPGDRAIYQNYRYSALAEILAATVWDYTSQPIFPTMKERGAASMRSLLNTVYHLSGAMYDGNEVGLGAYLATSKINTTTWREEYSFGSLNAYRYATQRITLGAGKTATYPCDGSENVPTAFFPANESPNPFPYITDQKISVGPPIYLKVDAGQTVTLTSNSLSGDGVNVPTLVLNNANDPNRDIYNKPYIAPNEVFVVPTVALQPDKDYQVTLNGKVGSTAFPEIKFTMRTAQ
jgi:hypothetical protein